MLTVEQLVNEAVKLKDPIYYDEWSHQLFGKAEEFHIENIAKIYAQIDRTSN
jgi:hypothetical protein